MRPLHRYAADVGMRSAARLPAVRQRRAAGVPDRAVFCGDADGTSARACHQRAERFGAADTFRFEPRPCQRLSLLLGKFASPRQACPRRLGRCRCQELPDAPALDALPLIERSASLEDKFVAGGNRPRRLSSLWHRCGVGGWRRAPRARWIRSNGDDHRDRSKN